MPAPQATLYLFLAQGIDVPLLSPLKRKLQDASSPFHDLDLSADETTWHYTQQWLKQQPSVLIVIDGRESTQISKEGIMQLKKTTGKLLRHKKKLSVAYSTQAEASPYWPYCKPLTKLPPSAIPDS